MRDFVLRMSWLAGVIALMCLSVFAPYSVYERYGLWPCVAVSPVVLLLVVVSVLKFSLYVESLD